MRLNYDRWGIENLRQVLERLGIAVPLEPMGQGFQDMSPAVKAFELLAVNGRIRHGNHPLLRWCFSQCGGGARCSGQLQARQGEGVWPDRRCGCGGDGGRCDEGERRAAGRYGGADRVMLRS